MGAPSSSRTSKSAAIPGWFRAARSRASWSKRERRSAFPTRSSGRALSATSRPRRVSRARQTSPCTLADMDPVFQGAPRKRLARGWTNLSVPREEREPRPLGGGRGLGSRHLRKGISTSRSSASHGSGAFVHCHPRTKWPTEQGFFSGSSCVVCAWPLCTCVETASAVNATAARRAGYLRAERSAGPTTGVISRPPKVEGVTPNDKPVIEADG